jgi:hypothetical protein
MVNDKIFLKKNQWMGILILNQIYLFILEFK